MSIDMGADDPALLADGLLMVFEGAHASSQIFGADGRRARWPASPTA